MLDALVVLLLVLSVVAISVCLYISRYQKRVWVAAIIPAVAGNMLAIAAAMHVYLRENKDRADEARQRVWDLLLSDFATIGLRTEYLLQVTSGNLNAIRAITAACSSEGTPPSDAVLQGRLSDLQNAVPITVNLIPPYDPILLGNRPVLSRYPIVYNRLRYVSAVALQSRGRLDIAMSSLNQQYHSAVNYSKSREFNRSMLLALRPDLDKPGFMVDVAAGDHPVVQAICLSAAQFELAMAGIDAQAREFGLLSCMIADAGRSEEAGRLAGIEELMRTSDATVLNLDELIKAKPTEFSQFVAPNGVPCVKHSGFR